MPTFRSMVELQSGLEKYLAVALDEVAERTWEELYKYIEEEVYIKNRLKLVPNGGYERTFDFLNSVKRSAVKKISGGYKAEIYIDDSAITPEWRENRLFNAHMSIGGTPMPEAMKYFIDKGNGNSRVYAYEGIEFMQFITNFLNHNYNALLKRELRKMGIAIK